MSEEGFPTAPKTSQGNAADWMYKVTQVINRVMDGKINSTGEVTLRANQTTTTVTDRRIGSKTKIFLQPTTATSASATPYVSAVTTNSITLTHDSDAATDRTFKYVIFG